MTVFLHWGFCLPLQSRLVIYRVCAVATRLGVPPSPPLRDVSSRRRAGSGFPPQSIISCRKNPTRREAASSCGTDRDRGNRHSRQIYVHAHCSMLMTSKLDGCRYERPGEITKMSGGWALNRQRQTDRQTDRQVGNASEPTPSRLCDQRLSAGAQWQLLDGAAPGCLQ